MVVCTALLLLALPAFPLLEGRQFVEATDAEHQRPQSL